jgi:hypothetical protein
MFQARSTDMPRFEKFDDRTMGDLRFGALRGHQCG